MDGTLVDQFLSIVSIGQGCKRWENEVVGHEEAYLVEKCHVDRSVDVIDESLRGYESIFHHPWQNVLR